MLRKTFTGTIAVLTLAMLFMAATTVGAADQYWTGAGDWNSTNAVWGSATGGPYTGTWAGDGAVFEGAAGAVNVTEPVSVNSILFNTASYNISGGTLNFGASAATYQIFNVVNNVDQTISSIITGSPSVGVASNTSQDKGLVFAPTTGTQTLGVITMAVEDGSGDKCAVTLSGSTTGNTVASVGFDAGHRWANLRKDGTGEWTVGNIDNGTVEILNGDFVATGTIYTRYRGIELKGGTMHYNTPILVTGGGFKFLGGSLDNTSGAAIAVPTEDGGSPVYQPAMTWQSNFTFLGSNGADSDLNLGTGAVTLTTSPTVTVQNVDTTFTVGGAITDGSNSYGLTKAGAGTLVLGGNNTYNGTTTVAGGTLSLGTAFLDDGGTLALNTGSTLNLTHTDTDYVFALTIDGSLAAPGVWGPSGSGAANESPLLTGTGFIDNGGGMVEEGTIYWDGPNVGGNGDGASDGGTGIWSTSNANWDVGLGARTAWDNTAHADHMAIFAGGGGTATLGDNITLKEIYYDSSSTGNYTIEGYNLNFSAGGVIDNATTGRILTITSGITGSPTVKIAVSSHNPYNRIYFEPTGTDTQTLGEAVLGYEDGSGDKFWLRLGGTTTGNSIGDMGFPVANHKYGVVEKIGASTWTTGNIDTGIFYMKEGTLVLNGTLHTYYSGLQFTGGTVAGTGTLSPHNGVTVPSGGALAPGDGVGTLNVGYAGKATTLSDGSFYEWEIGTDATDTINVIAGTLDANNFTLKILDAGGWVANDAVQLPVFTYDFAGGVTADITGFAGSFDTSALDLGKWTIGTLALTNDGAGTIYLTGLSGGTPTSVPVNWIGGTDLAWETGANWDPAQAAGPEANSLCTIDNGDTVELTAAGQAVYGIELGATTATGLNVSGELGVSDTVNVGANGTLNVTGTMGVKTLTVAAGGTVSGTIGVASSAALGDETITYESGSQGVALIGTDLGDKTVARTVAIPDGTVTIGGPTVDLGETDLLVGGNATLILEPDAGDATLGDLGLGDSVALSIHEDSTAAAVSFGTVIGDASLTSAIPVAASGVGNDITGITSGTLAVTGDLDVDGAQLALNFVPVYKDATSRFGGTYTIATVTGGTLTGTIDTSATLGNIGKAYIKSVDTSAGQVDVELYNLADGDINLDGKVDVSDLTILSQSWDVLGSNENTWLSGDMTFDGAVDVSDLSILSQAWAPGGVTLTGGSPATTAIPEPTSAMMLLLAAAGLLAYRRRR